LVAVKPWQHLLNQGIRRPWHSRRISPMRASAAGSRPGRTGNHNPRSPSSRHRSCQCPTHRSGCPNGPWTPLGLPYSAVPQPVIRACRAGNRTSGPVLGHPPRHLVGAPMNIFQFQLRANIGQQEFPMATLGRVHGHIETWGPRALGKGRNNKGAQRLPPLFSGPKL